MLIYNYQKEFVGIDESDLKALGFSDLSQLRSESSDFADLFVKTPGFVHNFKHVHWIDFVTCAEGSDDSKVVIHANGKNFRCILDIKTAYLIDNPTKKAYIINLSNLRALTHSENEQVAEDILEKPAPRTPTQNSSIFNTPDFSDNFNEYENQKTIQQEVPQEDIEVMHDPYEISANETLDELNSNSKVVEDIYEDSPIDLSDELLEIQEQTYENEDEKINIEFQEPSSPTTGTQEFSRDSNYTYDPHLASDELGLPVDLIEEFIQDFINQANDFKDDLYKSLLDGNIDNVKILSHKLKGVAANLRIEDAFEVLTTVNTSNDTDEIKTNMDTFYFIIEKLSDKNSDKAQTPEEISSENEENDDDDLVISFKDDLQEEKITDNEVPQKIEMPELADDDFLNADIIQNDDSEIELEDITFDDDIPDLESTQDAAFSDKALEIEKLNDLEQTIAQVPKSTYNKDLAANEIGIDPKNFEILFNDYIIEAKNSCTQINDAIQQNNSLQWRQTAIALKGMSDNMRIKDFTQELESLINTQDANLAKESINSISTKLEQISGKEV